MAFAMPLFATACSWLILTATFAMPAPTGRPHFHCALEH
jgi:hypothetical protein